MNRNEFIEKLLNFYEDFTEKNTKNRVEAYLLVLPKELPSGFTYEQLWIKLIRSYDSLKFAPSPAFLLNLIEGDSVTQMQRMYENVE